MFALAAIVVAGVVPASADGPLNRLTTVPIGSVAHDLDLKDGFMYVATDAGLTVVDLSTMQPRGSLPTTSANMGIKVRGQYAYLAGVTGGFRVVDISDPDALVLVATRPAPYAYDVALKDNVAFVPSFAGELYVFDIEHPTNPVRHAVLGLPAWRTPGPDATGLHNLNTYVTAGNAKASGATVKGSILITTDWAYGRIYYHDVSNARSPVFRGTHYAPYVLKVDVKVDVDPDRAVIFMLSAYGPASGIYTVPILSLSPDVSTAHATCPACGYIPSTIPFVGIDQGGLALGAGGDYLVYGGGRNTGEFNVVDVRNPLAMTNVATLPVDPVDPHGVVVGQIMGVRIEGDLAYFAAGRLGVQIYQFAGLSGAGGPPPPDTPPTILSFALNSGATSTANRVVTLSNAVSGTPTEYRASEAANFAGAAWAPYSAAPTFSMTGANGSKLVYFQVRNASLDESTVVSDTITLSEPAPNVTAYALNGGANTTTDRTITLNHTASNNPSRVPGERVGDVRGRCLAAVLLGADLPAESGQRDETRVLPGA